MHDSTSIEIEREMDGGEWLYYADVCRMLCVRVCLRVSSVQIPIIQCVFVYELHNYKCKHVTYACSRRCP